MSTLEVDFNNIAKLRTPLGYWELGMYINDAFTVAEINAVADEMGNRSFVIWGKEKDKPRHYPLIVVEAKEYMIQFLIEIPNDNQV